MKISEYLKQYADNEKNVIITHTRITRLFNSMIQLNNSWSGFALFVKKFLTGLYTPQSVEDFCRDFFGITELEELTKFVESGNLKNVYNYIYPSFNQFKFKGTVKGDELVNILKDSWLEFSDSKNIVLVDTNYRMFSEDYIKEVLRKCPYNYTRNYEQSTFDCDDFALATKSWINLRCGGANTFGYVHAMFYNKDNKYIFAHAFNIVVTKNDKNEYKVAVIEPQTDKLYFSVEQVSRWFHSAERFKIYFVYF